MKRKAEKDILLSKVKSSVPCVYINKDVSDSDLVGCKNTEKQYGATQRKSGY